MNCSKVTRVAIVERITLIDAYNALPRLHRIMNSPSPKITIGPFECLPKDPFASVVLVRKPSTKKTTNIKTRVNTCLNRFFFTVQPYACDSSTTATFSGGRKLPRACCVIISVQRDKNVRETI